ncbi:hypothetical protein WR25_27213 [Diploscapter pachys]|uniref:Lytic transglycosylase MltA domain-containing protein n=1 Tax=Diploscapter pachys TaxID=2018661 RepID=A0A2A2K8K7_9BILA|nr:hypothetical protein WR25_27213 [Diploscapter pachys]
MKSALRHLAWALPALALLAGCNGGESAKPEPHAIATYVPATWKDLPQVSDDDLLAGFYAWRNGCEKLKRDPVWAATCEAAGSAMANADQLEGGRQLRLGYADQNGHPYRPIGRWLVEQGQLPKEQVTMGSIHAWAQANPKRIPELLASNPSYVIPLGSLLWLSTTRPDGSPVVRPVGAQDTGGAITGEVRADLFWGTGPEAGELAGNMKQQGQIWMLWPKGQPLPEVPKVP